MKSVVILQTFHRIAPYLLTHKYAISQVGSFNCPGTANSPKDIWFSQCVRYLNFVLTKYVQWKDFERRRFSIKYCFKINRIRKHAAKMQQRLWFYRIFYFCYFKSLNKWVFFRHENQWHQRCTFWSSLEAVGNQNHQYFKHVRKDWTCFSCRFWKLWSMHI